ncbi:MAG: hypothetical protein AAFW83_12715 [Pseudomonadota bacterium]
MTTNGFQKGYQAQLHHRPIPHSHSYDERYKIAQGVNAAKAHQNK